MSADDIQIISMSATIGNLDEVAKFLKAKIYTHDFRPVELTEYVKCDNNLYKVVRNDNGYSNLKLERKMELKVYSQRVNYLNIAYIFISFILNRIVHSRGTS